MTEPAFEPRIIGFLCNWCSYAGADKAGAAQVPYPPHVHFVRVMCTGRIDPHFVLQAFAQGADGVVILACHPGDCHYKEGNLRALQRHRLLLRLLGQLGIGEERCRFDYVSAAEGDKLAAVVGDLVKMIRAAGPLPVRPEQEIGRD
ncbi:MAG: hydrogenase iron-sulfur subunit [Desulfobacteraceae bacterium]|nr:hydrogenase iron-sulfur subunit [Desulfobacteraceae bacterium]